jgi:excisionase family DNA binding protein
VFINIQQVANRLQVSRLTIRRWWLAGLIPQPAVKVKKTLRWRESDIEEWIEQSCPAREQSQPEAIVTN